MPLKIYCVIQYNHLFQAGLAVLSSPFKLSLLRDDPVELERLLAEQKPWKAGKKEMLSRILTENYLVLTEILDQNCWTACGGPGSNGILPQLALESQELFSMFLFLIHFLLCFCAYIVLCFLSVCPTGPMTYIFLVSSTSTIAKVGMWLRVQWLNSDTHKNFTNAMIPQVLAGEQRRCMCTRRTHTHTHTHTHTLSLSITQKQSH